MSRWKTDALRERDKTEVEAAALIREIRMEENGEGMNGSESRRRVGEMKAEAKSGTPQVRAMGI